MFVRSIHIRRAIRCFAAPAALVALAIPARAVNWQEFGPAPQLRGAGSSSVSGRVSALAYSPDIDGNGTGALFVGSASGGVWRSINFESPAPQWTPLTDDLGLHPQLENGAVCVGSIAVDPFHPNIIYVGTGEANFSGDSRHGAGILKSTDGGDTWTLLAAGTFGRQSISKIFVDPTDNTGNTLFCSMVAGAGSPSASRGVFKSENGGVSWVRVSTVLGTGTTVTDMDYTLDADNNLTIYAAVRSSGVWRSTDGGASWIKWPLTVSTSRISLAADHTPGASPAVYAVTESGPNVYVSRNHGASWTATNRPIPPRNPPLPSTFSFAGGQGWYDLAIALAPDGRITLGGVSYPFNSGAGVLESVDGGATWAAIDVGTNGLYPHTDHHAFLWVNGYLYNGNDGGVNRFTPVPSYNQSFQLPVQSNVNGGAARLATGDINADGMVDIVVTGDTTNRVTILLGRGNGQFGVPQAYLVGTNPVGVAIGRVDGDEFPDVVTANKGADTVSLLRGNGNGSLQTPTDLPTGGAGPIGVALADINNDGRLDIVTANETSNDVSILIQNEDGTFAEPMTVPAGARPSDVAVGDVNNDNLPDIVTANSAAGTVSVLRGAEDGSWSPFSYTVGSSPVSVRLADVTGDGLPDIVAACQGSNWVAVLPNTGTEFGGVLRTTTGSSPSGVAVAAITDDGFPDVVTANKSAGNITFLPGGPEGALGPREDVAAGASPVWVEAADFNNDGRADVAVVNAGTAVSVLIYGPSVNPGGGPGRWESLNTTGLGTIQIQGVTLHPTNPAISLEGSQDNGTARRSGSIAWSSVSGGDGGIVRFDPKNGTFAYKVAPQGSFGTTQFFQYSSNGGSSWSGRTDTISGDTTFPLEHEDGAMSPEELAVDTAFPFYPFFTVYPDDGSRLAIGSTRVYQSTNRALNWTAISGVLAGGRQVSSLAYAPGYPNTLYAGFNGGPMYRTTNGGASWTQLAAPWGSGRVSGIVVSNAGPDVVYVAISTTSAGRVWKSVNGGVSWTNISGTLPFIGAQSIVIDDRTGTLYLGMDLGMWASQNDDGQWIRFGGGLPNAQVLDVQLSTTTDLLAAGTHGRGAWVIGVMPGDINGDRKLDATDAALALGIWGGLSDATREDAFRGNIAPGSPGIQLDDVVAIIRAGGGLA